MNVAFERLHNQQVAGSRLESAKEVVAWMGAMQAQDLAMAKWAVGVRLSGSTVASIEQAINRGEIIRTHVMRPTWHFVAADDVYWMLELTAPGIRASMKARHRQLGITSDMVATTTRIMERMLRGTAEVSRKALVAEFERAGILDEGNRAAHLLAWAELDGLVCSGPSGGAQQSYFLLAEKVPKKKSLDKDEALASLATRYFTSHGPATLPDFIWWSGLRTQDARQALELTKPQLVAESIGQQTYWSAASRGATGISQAAYLLPAFDEFIISYRDRSAALPGASHAGAISSNGVFRPVVVVGGKVTGIWRRAAKGRKVELEVEPFLQPDESTRERIAKAASRYGRFLEREVVLRFKDGQG